MNPPNSKMRLAVLRNENYNRKQWGKGFTEMACGGICDVSFVFFGVADFQRQDYRRDMYLRTVDFSRTFLFYLPLYGLQRKEGEAFVSASAAVCGVFLGVG